MELTTLIGLTHQRVGFASRSTIVSACGRYIYFRDIFSNRKDYIECPGQGVKNIVFNTRENVFAVAEINEDPSVFVYDSLSRKLLRTIEDVGAMEVAALGFSAYGNRLVTVSGEPDYKVKVWDLKTGKLLVEEKIDFLATDLVYHPHSKNEFVVCGKDHMVFFQVEEMYQKYLLTTKTPDLMGLVPTCCEWNPRGGLLIGCKTGEVILQDSAAEKPMMNSDGEIVIVAKANDTVTTIAVQGRSVILGIKDQPCKMFPLSQVSINPASRSESGVFPGVVGASFIGFDPYYDKAIIITAQSCMYIFDINRGLSTDRPVISYGATHQGKVTSIKFLDESSHFASASCDNDQTGSLCVWSIADGSLLWREFFRSEQTTMDCFKAKKIVASAGKDGVVTIVDFSQIEAPRVIFRKKMHTKEVQSLSFSLDGNFLATLGGDGKIYFLSIEGQDVRPIGYVTIAGNSISLAWTKHLDLVDSGILLVSLSTNEVMGINPPPRDYKSDELYLEDMCNVRRFRLDSNATAMQGFDSVTGDPGTIVVIGNDKKVKQYRLPADDQGWGGFKGRVTQPENVYHSLMKQGDAITVSANKKKIVSASKEGKIVINSAESESENITLSPHSSILGGTSAVACDADGSCIISGGNTGEILVYSAASKEISAATKVKYEVKHQVPSEGDFKLDILREHNLGVRQRLLAEAEPVKATVRESLRNLQDQIQLLIQENAQAPALEQLEFSEFILDKQYVEEWEQLSSGKAKTLKKELVDKRTKNIIITNRLKDLAWNSMRQKGSVISSLNTGVKVCNFPIGKPSRESKFLQKLVYLRSVEKAELAYLKEDKDDATLSADDGAEPQPPQSKSPSKDAPAAEVKKSVVNELLYPDAKMSHPRRKRLQILMIQELIMESKDAFNKLHKKHKEQKESLVDRIGELNKRAKELSDEIIALGGSKPEEEMFGIQMSSSEIPDNFLNVKEEEISVERYLSPAERQRIAEEEAAEEARRAAQKGDNVGERGLKDMMGGTLHKAKASEVSDLERPEWMDMPMEDMSEEQRKELKEFEAEQKLVMEEREKRRKALEAEYKKIRSDALELCVKFDESVTELHKEKLDATSLVYMKEMDIIRLSLALEQAERIDAIRKEQLLDELEDLKLRKQETGDDLSNFKHEVDTELETLETYIQEDKALEKIFKKDFTECEEFYDRLLKLFRKRTHKGRVNSEKSGQQLIQGIRRQGNVAGKMNRRMSMLAVGQQDLRKQAPRVASYLQDSHESDSDEIANDPWLRGITSLTESSENQILEIDPLDAAQDRPEGLDPHWWNKLVEARNRKIQAETEVKKQMNLVLRMQKYLAYLTNMDNDLKAKVENVTLELNDLETQRDYRVWDVDMSLNVKQGQVEIIEDLVSANMDDALLLDRTVIQDRNQIIEKHGGQKVDILKAIKDFKKGIYDIEWENNRLDMLEEDWAQKTKEFQLLRVTKGLQSFLKSGEDTSNSSEHAALESRLDHNKALSAKSVKEKQKTLHKIQRVLMDVKQHNMELQSQVTELEYAVQEEQHANKSKKDEQDAGGKKSAARRMRSLVTERKLADISKAQAEEISLLKQELERLRRRTFPSFSTMRT